MVVISQNPADNIIIGVIAIFFLIYVSDKVISRSINISKKIGISQIFIGLTIISIGTSLPEITTSVIASLDINKGSIDPFIASGTVLGTNIGSDIVQQNLLMGIVGLLAIIHGRTMYIKRSFLKQDFLIMILAAVLVLLFGLDGSISRIEGSVLFMGYILYIWFLWMREDKKIKENKKIVFDGRNKKGFLLDFIYIIIGLAIIVISSEFILRVSEFFVIEYNVGASMIGVLVVGIATSLPELTTSITAILRGASSISLGTLIGSNITNPLFALGLGAIISTYQVPKPLIIYDLPVNIVTALIIMWILWRARKITKKASIIMITMYVVYVLIRLKYFVTDI